MEHVFSIIKATRVNFLKLVDSLSPEQLNEIPAGFNNNIAWNFGHIQAAQQLLCYERAGLKADLPATLMQQYCKGSKPEKWISEGEIQFFKNDLLASLEKLEQQWRNGYFEKLPYEKIKTVYGVELGTHDDAVRYMSTHDALHYGYSLALRKLIQKQATTKRAINF